MLISQALGSFTQLFYSLDYSHHSYSPGEQNRPSIAGITASHELSLVLYWGQTRVQEPGLSVIQDLGSMVEVSFSLSLFSEQTCNLYYRLQ